MTQKVLITGGAGMLASDLVTYLTQQPAYEVISLPRADLDISQSTDILAAFEAHQPQVVINTAAVHVDDAESNPAKAYHINAWAVRNLAQACQRHGTVFVHISTCGLFGDDIRPYHEYDPVVLKTVYAQSKHAGDLYIPQTCEQYFILRLGWLYGGSVEHRKNFVVARYQEAQKKPVLQSASDKHGSPTYTGDVAKTLVDLLESQQYGLYHVANQGGGTRVDYVERIVRAFGLSNPVEPVDSSHFPRKANVPDCELLTSFNLTYAGIDLLPPWEEAIDRYVHSIWDQVGS